MLLKEQNSLLVSSDSLLAAALLSKRVSALLRVIAPDSIE
jgi:hypothetical protein